MEAGPTKRDLRALKHDHRDLIRVLILDPWFRTAVVLVSLGFIAALVGLPKIWRMTPPGFRPQVRVSVLNLAQAWQLRRAALAKQAEGRDLEAVPDWYAAFAKNAADVETVRAALRSVVTPTNVPPNLIQRMALLPAWLLRLSATNQADVVLAAQYLDRADEPESVYALLEPLKEGLSPQAEVIYLKALIERGDAPQYAARWKRAEAELQADAKFALYHQAYLAIWGPADGRVEASAQLAKATEDPATRTTAWRLQLLQWAAARNIPNYAAVLERLTEGRLDRVPDHVQYWALLLEAGRRDEARSLAQQYTLISRNPRDLLALAGAQEALELKEEAKRLLRTTSLNYGGGGTAAANALWLSRANLLTRAQDWLGLLELVQQLRTFPATVEQLGGWVDAVEGQAHHGSQRAEQARLAFEAAASKRFWTPQLEFDSALLAKRLGYREPALAMLLAVERDFREKPAYWEAVFDLAVRLRKDAVLALKAATELRRLAPNLPVVDYNYAAALLANRMDPAQAVVLTRAFLAGAPTSPETKVNHCLALALNQRFDEAKALLQTVDPLRFDEFGQTVFRFCAFEVAIGRNDLAGARQHLELIQPKFLFPPQAEWLDRMRRERLEPASARANL